jgi:outer membrane immunogenic protein
MKKTAIAIAYVALTAVPAAAADLSRGFAPAPYSAFSWAGPYIGANLGGQWGSAGNSGADPYGFMGGIQVGYNWQTGQFVYGVETDLNFSGADDTFAGRTFSNPWFGTVRARAGVSVNNIFFYGTGGLAYGRGEIESLGISETHTHFGWTLGVGAEVGLTPNWSVKAEYLFIDLRDERYGLTGLDHDFESSLLRFGFNYRF